MASLEPYEDSPWENDDRLGKIKQITLKDTAIIEIIRVESPSSIFVRPKDHISDQLVYKEPYPLIPINDFSTGNFALAPLEDRVFARCVILKIYENEQSCTVFFIDEAVTATVSKKCLFEVEESQQCIPWQVMHVSLGRLISLNNFNWSLEQCNAFSKVLSNFEYFQISACQVDLSTESDRPSLLVNMYGLDDLYNSESSISIEEMCVSSMKDVMISIFPVNLIGNPLISELDMNSKKNAESFRLEPPSNWIHELPQNWATEEIEWALENCVIEWNIARLKKNVGENGCFYCVADWNTTVSPSDMTIYPLALKSEDDDENWLVNELKAMNNFSLYLQDFYSDTKNQKPLSYDEINNAVNNRTFYAIAFGPLSGKWARVEILGLPTANSATLRFLDNGRKTVQKLKTLFRIHKVHCTQLPLSLKCGRDYPKNTLNQYAEIRFEDKEHIWSESDCTIWKQLVPFDTPLLIGPQMEFLENGKLLINSLRESTEDKNLFDGIPKPIDLG